MAVFDREGDVLTSQGEDILQDAQGSYFDQHDNFHCTE